MKRPLLWAFGASVLGEILAYRYPEVEGMAVAAGGLLAAWFLVWFGQNRQWLFLPVFFVLGFGMLRQAAEPSGLAQLTAEAGKAGVSGGFSGEVREIRRSASGWKVTLEAVTFFPDADGGERGISGEGVLLYLENLPDFVPGDRVRGNGVLTAFEEASNPGQFDSRAYYRALHLDARCTAERLERTAPGHRYYAVWLFRLRLSLLEGLDALETARPDAAWQQMLQVLKAMLLGERAEVAEEVTRALEAGGISHLLAISGLHISLVGMSLFRLLKKQLALPYGAAVFLSTAAVAGYCAMAGRSASSFRAFAMFLCLIVGEMKGKPYDLMSACGAAGLIVLADSPLLLFQAGFQLSFLAIAGIGMVFPLLRRWLGVSRKGEGLVLCVSVQIVTFPAVAWHMFSGSPGGLFLNLLAVPMMSVLAGCGAAGMVLALFSRKAGMVILTPAAFLVDGLLRLSSLVGSWPGMRICPGRPSAACLALYLAGWGLFFCRIRRRTAQKTSAADADAAKKGRVRRALALTAVGILLTGVLGVRGRELLRITVLDVGQGDGILLELPGGETVFVDGGSSDVSHVGEYRIRPCLESLGIDRIDTWIVTHLDEDHKNGAEELLVSGFPAGQILLSDVSGPGAEERAVWQKAAASLGIPVRHISAGMGWETESGVCLRCLYPKKGMAVEEENAASFVLYVEYGSFAALLTGDLGIEEEGAVVEALAAAGDLSGREVFLKAGHHGSRFSTGRELLEALCPDWAAISCGEGNRYGHPHPELLERLEDSGVGVWETEKAGAVLVETDGKQTRISGFRTGFRAE